jgi:hypothetical protein
MNSIFESMFLLFVSMGWHCLPEAQSLTGLQIVLQVTYEYEYEEPR